MRRRIVLLVCSLTMVAGLAASGVAAQEAQPAPAGLSPTVDNPYFPLAPGSSRRYEGEELDPETGEPAAIRVQERVSPVSAEVAGAPVTAVAVREYENGELIEATSDYHAQDADGAVLYLGEDVNKYENGQLVSHDGTWLAGEGANQAGVFMTAEPMVGQRFAQERAPGIAEDTSTIIAVDLTVTTPAGTFFGCIKTRDLNPLDQSVEHKYYCPEVGLVREESAHGYLDLVSYSAG